MKETQSINASLTALADVLSALSEGGSSALVPYRNSKLTRLLQVADFFCARSHTFLQDSLGGNSKTFFILNLNPLASNYRETLVTLQYGARTKKIK